jgi:hypothetical protein
MSRSMVGLFAAVAATMSVLAGVIHGPPEPFLLVGAGAASGLTAYLALPKAKKTCRRSWRRQDGDALNGTNQLLGVGIPLCPVFLAGAIPRFAASGSGPGLRPGLAVRSAGTAGLWRSQWLGLAIPRRDPLLRSKFHAAGQPAHAQIGSRSRCP